jgi:hypothetical protein
VGQQRGRHRRRPAGGVALVALLGEFDLPLDDVALQGAELLDEGEAEVSVGDDLLGHADHERGRPPDAVHALPQVRDGRRQLRVERLAVPDGRQQAVALRLEVRAEALVIVICRHDAALAVKVKTLFRQPLCRPHIIYAS